jgi:hypothetical protein
VWWFIPVISALWRLRQEDHEFEAILGYIARETVLTDKTPKRPFASFKKK